jgi:hypothetical protein
MVNKDTKQVVYRKFIFLPLMGPMNRQLAISEQRLVQVVKLAWMATIDY